METENRKTYLKAPTNFMKRVGKTIKTTRKKKKTMKVLAGGLSADEMMIFALGKGSTPTRFKLRTHIYIYKGKGVRFATTKQIKNQNTHFRPFKVTSL